MADIRFSEDARFGRPARIAILVAFALLVVAGLGAVIVAMTSDAAEQWSAHSQVVRQTEAELLSAVQDAETGQRGYLLTGDPTYLAPFHTAEAVMPGLRRQLTALVADNPDQRARLAVLYGVVDRKVAELDSTIALERAGDHDGAVDLLWTGEGRRLMLELRAADRAFDAAELKLLADRQARARAQRTLLLGLIVIAVLTAGALAYFVGMAARAYALALADRNSALLGEAANRQKAEAQLRQAQKMEALGQLTGGVAHDFNNMLAIIIGNLDMLMRRLAGREDRLRDLAENALSGANRAAALTRRLLAFSRQQPLEPKATDVNKCVTDMSEMLRRSLGERIVVETVLGGGLWRALIDAPQLESAILNLAVNGRDAMPDGGKLTIETSNAALDRRYADANDEVGPGQYVLVAITDTGVGMTPEVLEKAFDPFFTTKKVGAGTGLGLSQVHGFLKQSHGHIKLYSEPGVGTTAKLYLPRFTGHAEPEPGERRPEVAAPDGRFTVLVVEDDPGVRDFTVGAARELGFTVVEADGAAEALERLEAHPDICVLLTDVVMPGTTGRQLADAAIGLRPGLKVIYMTGYTRNAIVHNGVLDAGTRLLTKPFTLDQLGRELREAIDESPRGSAADA